MTRRRYTDDERATAVLFLESEGYPDTPGALTRVAKRLGIPHPTLHRWATGKQNPPPSDLVQEKRPALIEMIRAEAYAILDDMKVTRELADYRELGTVFGIMLDKLQLLEGKPTEHIQHDISDDERSARVAALLDTARTRRDGSAADDPDALVLH
jgi:transposase-like protein